MIRNSATKISRSLCYLPEAIYLSSPEELTYQKAALLLARQAAHLTISGRMGRIISLALFACAAAVAHAWVLDSRMHHLRSGSEAEWQEFDNKTPEAKSLDFYFQSHTNKRDLRLFVRQADVKLEWNVKL